MRIAPLLLLTVLISPSFAQDGKESILRDFVEEDIEQIGLVNLDSSSSLRTYRIWITYQQVIELNELKNSKFEGFVLNYVTKRLVVEKENEPN